VSAAPNNGGIKHGPIKKNIAYYLDLDLIQSMMIFLIGRLDRSIDRSPRESQVFRIMRGGIPKELSCLYQLSSRCISMRISEERLGEIWVAIPSYLTLLTRLAVDVLKTVDRP
jgi:hypothetical protein